VEAHVRGNRIVVRATAAGDAQLEVWKAGRKGDLARKLFGMELAFRMAAVDGQRSEEATTVQRTTTVKAAIE
jgi:hypothetical protein